MANLTDSQVPIGTYITAFTTNGGLSQSQRFGDVVAGSALTCPNGITNFSVAAGDGVAVGSWVCRGFSGYVYSNDSTVGQFVYLWLRTA